MKKVSTDWKFFSSDAAVFSGSYFKIKQIQLGYTLPKAISSVAGISNLRVYCSLDDFFTITKYPGADPETASINSGASRGFDNGTYPTSKKVVFGINVTF
jgi:TonB-dependent starch-binding outer membrane protein SusC